MMPWISATFFKNVLLRKWPKTDRQSPIGNRDYALLEPLKPKLLPTKTKRLSNGCQSNRQTNLV
jgi:hypothetical protein